MTLEIFGWEFGFECWDTGWNPHKLRGGLLEEIGDLLMALNLLIEIVWMKLHELARGKLNETAVQLAEAAVKLVEEVEKLVEEVEKLVEAVVKLAETTIGKRTAVVQRSASEERLQSKTKIKFRLHKTRVWYLLRDKSYRSADDTTLVRQVIHHTSLIKRQQSP